MNKKLEDERKKTEEVGEVREGFTHGIAILTKCLIIYVHPHTPRKPVAISIPAAPN